MRGGCEVGRGAVMTRVKTGETLSRAALAKPTRPLERTVHIAILKWLRAEVSACVWHARNEGHRAGLGHVHDAALGSMAGASDLMGVVEYGRPGVFFAVEVKRPGFKASEVRPAQVAFGHAVMDRGGLFCIAGSVEEVKAWAVSNGIVRPRGWAAPWKMPPIDWEEMELHRL